MSDRIAAVQKLILEQDRRETKANWKAIFDDEDLTPPTNSKEFEKGMFELLSQEMKDGVARQDAQRSKPGAGRMTGNLMHVSPAIARYIFAEFSWHDADAFPDKADKLRSMAAVFRFKLDPQEIELQKLSDEERLEAMKAQFETADDKESKRFFWATLALLIPTVLLIIRKLT